MISSGPGRNRHDRQAGARGAASRPRFSAATDTTRRSSSSWPATERPQRLLHDPPGYLRRQSDAQEVHDAYDEAYGKAPDSVFAALGYDGINLMADAINRAGDTAGDKIRDALGSTTGFKGATGEISYTKESHIPTKSVALVEVKDGKFDLIKTIVPKTVPKA